MPFYYRRPYYRYRRQRRYRRARLRRYFRRRPYRRYWVSNPYNKLTLKQWSPPFKKTCYIKGQCCIIYYNNERLGWNSTMYEKSTVPFHWPGGGSFSVSQYTLDVLFDMHKTCRNWWTGSNEDLPLCRYKGCELKFYQCNYVDYIVKVINELPANSNKLTYPSTQPNIMLMSQNKHIIASKQNRKKRKPYTKLKVPPPPQFQNKWYFTTDLYKIPLMHIHATTANLTNPYVKPQNLSNNITFWGINTQSIQNKAFNTQDTFWPFKKLGTLQHYFYFHAHGTEDKSEDFLIADLIPLTNPTKNTHGFAFNDLPPATRGDIKNYIDKWENYAGNPFYKDINEHIEDIYYSLRSPQYIKSKKSSITTSTKWKDINEESSPNILTPFNEPIYIPFQYNPEKDTGEDTEVYLVNNRDGHGWENPGIPEITLSGFPLWIILWGYIDFQKNLKKAINIDTEYIMVFKSKYTQRPKAYPIVIINESFIQGNSPYENKPLPEDETKWFPMVQYQTQEQNKILSVGPFAPNSIQCKSDNVCMYYKFKFEWGGTPPKHITIENPTHQIQYPVPSNEHETNSLQNPGQAPESILYSFDFRHGDYTTAALSRITKDWPIKETVSTLAEPTKRQLLQQAFQFLQDSEETQEKKEKEMQNIINQLRNQQQLYRQQIIELTTQM
nr:MAG: ORF1 [TTV-like mini virus]UGV39644.1 MAG: ORF1 [TTV-like mini virus]UGV42299.1 MAG: ORF1 [TTV-like mini virus]